MGIFTVRGRFSDYEFGSSLYIKNDKEDNLNVTSQKKMAVRRCSLKQVFLKISQYSQESTWLSIFNKIVGLQTTTQLFPL